MKLTSRRWIGPLSFCAAAVLLAPTPAVAEGDAATVSATTAWSFDETERWTIWWPTAERGPAPFTAAETGDGWQVRVEPGDSYLILNAYSQPLRAEATPGVESVTLRLDAATDTPARVYLSLHDEGGERFYLEPQTLDGGPQELRWSFPGDVFKTGGKNVNGVVDGAVSHGHLYVERPNGHSARPVEITFHGAELHQQVAPIRLVTAGLETGHPLRVVHPDRLGEATIALTNAADRPIALTGLIGVRDSPAAEGRGEAEVRVTLAAGATTALAIPQDLIAADPQRRHGIRYADWRFTADGGGDQAVEGASSFAVMDPVGPTPGVDRAAFVFGLAGFHSEWSAPDDRLALITRATSEIGVEAVRFGTMWRSVEPKPGEWNWEPLDRLVRSAEGAGMEPQLMLSFGGAAWTKPPESLARAKADNAMDRQWRYPPRPELWRGFVRAVAERYRGRVRLWEVWNEPDIGFFRGTADQYLELLTIAHEELKSVDPGNVVISGGLAAYSHRDAKHDLYERLMSEATPYYDYFGYHRHGTFGRLYDEIEGRIIPMRERLGGADRPFYFNETGLAREFEREDEMADSLVKKLTYVWSRGAAGYHWFCMWVPAHRTGAAQGYRMLNGDFSPRPAFVGYNTLARQLRGRRFVRQLDLGEGRFGFLFRGAGHFTGRDESDYVAVVWTERPGLSPAVVAMDAGGAERVRVVSVMGDTREATRVGDRALVHIEREPTFVVLDGAALREPGSSEPVLTPPLALSMLPGRLSTAGVELRNPADDATPVAVEWSAAGPVELHGPASRTLTLGPGEALQIEQGVRLRGDPAVSAQPPGLTLKWRLGAQSPWNRTAIDLRPALRVTSAQPAGRSPDLVLDQARYVVNHNDIDPQTRRFMWRGAADLSVRAWVWRRGDRLGVRLDVADDRHRQTHPARQMWKGDSLQFGFAVPGRTGFLEFGLARSADGRAMMHTWNRPEGLTGKPPIYDPTVQRLDGGVTRYRFELDLAQLAGSAAAGDEPFGLSFVLNDDDEDRREGFLQLTPGIAEGKDPSLFVPLVIE